MTDDNLISIRDAARIGWTKLRLDKWANPYDHFEFYNAGNGMFGPWVKLRSPSILHSEPMLITTLGDVDEKCWRKFVG